MVCIHIQLLQKRQLFILLFFISMAFDVSKRDVLGQVAFTESVPDFSYDIPVRFHGGVWIGCLVLGLRVGLVNHAFVITNMDALDSNIIESLEVKKASED